MAFFGIRWPTALTLFLLGAVVMLLLPGFVVDLKYAFRDRLAPVVYHAAWAEPAQARPGERIVVHYQGIRSRSCPNTIKDHLVSLERGQRVKSWGPIQGNYTEVGDFAVSFPIDLPADIEPGAYVYRSRIKHACNGDVFNNSHPPDIEIFVLPSQAQGG